jgi:hypothetical protein
MGVLSNGTHGLRYDFTEYSPATFADQHQFPLFENNLSHGRVHLVECACGMAFVNPMPTAESIPLLYPGDYLRDKTDLASLYSRMMTYLPVERGKLLDIGCGRGDFINHASKEGWEVEGVDLMDWGTPHDVPIRVGDFLTMDLLLGHCWNTCERLQPSSNEYRSC